MKPNKVVFGAVSIMDISDSTVTPETLGEGATAYDKSGEKITGTMKSGIDTSDATATASDMASGVTAYVNGQKVTGAVATTASNGGVQLSNNTTASLGLQSNNTVVRSMGTFASDRLMRTGSKVYVNVPGTQFGDAMTGHVLEGRTFTSENGVKKTGVMPTQAAQTITPGISDQTIASGRYLSGTQTIKGDSNLVAENIKSGVSIFGVAGSYEGSGGGSGGGSVETCTVTISAAVPVNLVSVTVIDPSTGKANVEYIGWTANPYSQTFENVLCNSAITVYPSGGGIDCNVSGGVQQLGNYMTFVLSAPSEPGASGSVHFYSNL